MIVMTSPPKKPWALFLLLMAVLTSSDAFVPTTGTTSRLESGALLQLGNLPTSGRIGNSINQNRKGTELFVFASRKNKAAKAAAGPEELIEESEEQEEEEDSSSSSNNGANDWMGSVRGNRFRQLKDLVWIRETVEDLTAAEFACSVELASMQEQEEDQSRKRRRAVDYDKLLAQLNKRLRDLGCMVDDNDDSDVVFCELDSSIGKGTTVYNDAQRLELYENIIKTREKLLGVVRGYEVQLEKKEPFKIKLPSIQIQKEDNVTTSTAAGPTLYVRDDGTVDWEGALQDREALKTFGTAVWARINGRNPTNMTDDDDDVDDEGGGHGGSQKAVTAKIEDTPQIVAARTILTNLQQELKDMERAHTNLLSSALSEGQAVANVNLASLAPALRSEIRESADALDKKRQEVTYKSLIYELERIYTYLYGEVGNPTNKGYVPLQDRLNVAEFGLLESQIDSFTREIELGENVDADVLVVVGDQVTEFKRRLGIDFYVTGVSFDSDAIKRQLGELLKQTKNGLAFYGRGCQLFWNDLVFCGFLIGRAAQGYTLKPREVRNLRRTAKDFFTSIPFIIILLIPLSPIGHVLVFGAIQRFFPDFFPSCFTEQRQNLLQLYETAEYSEFKINETFQQKVSRLALASAFIAGKTSRGVFVRISQLLQGEQENLNQINGDGLMNGASDENESPRK